jgi:hypothetical protein
MESTKMESKLKLFIPFKGDMHDERKENKDSTRKDVKEPYPKTVDILNNFAKRRNKFEILLTEPRKERIQKTEFPAIKKKKQPL